MILPELVQAAMKSPVVPDQHLHFAVNNVWVH